MAATKSSTRTTAFGKTAFYTELSCRFSTVFVVSYSHRHTRRPTVILRLFCQSEQQRRIFKTSTTMKKNILSVLAICAALLGCQKNEISETRPSGVDLHATIEDDAFTKTVMDESNNIRWSEGDQIIAFMKSSYGHKYKLISSFAGKTYADFEPVTFAGGNLSAGTEWNHNVVYYPYSADVEAVMSGDNYTIDIALPTEQTYAPESFGNGTFPMVAVSENNNITFKNICGGMKLHLKGAQKVVSIQLQGKNNEKLSGAATVTAYTDGETKPAITMASTASTSVTVNCGTGIQLNESTATEFIISLPPVAFTKGFTVTVTDDADKTYTVETDKANTVLRSSILNMPAVSLAESEGGSPEENVPEGDIVPVDLVKLNHATLVLPTRFSYTLTANITPIDATDQTPEWSSDNQAVVTVDQSGTITTISEGTANITAVADGVAGTCSITVIAPTTREPIDYNVDGVSYGKGIIIGDVIWAPVNCGYEPATSDSKGYPYGKLYQWGRKYGQGYTTSYDATAAEIVEGPISVVNGQKDKYTNTFFNVEVSPCDWTSPQDDKLWNLGTESNPIKTEYDPCPKGWRVPTYAEMDQLSSHCSSWTTVEGQNGYYFSGIYTYLDVSPSVFCPAAGSLSYKDGNAGNRGYYGNYWSSRASSYYSGHLYFYSNFVGTYINSNRNLRAYGYSVRCVQESSSSVSEEKVEIVCAFPGGDTKAVGLDEFSNMYLEGDDFVDVNGVDYPVKGNGTKTFAVTVPKADSYIVSYPANALNVNSDGMYSVNLPDEYVGSSLGVFVGAVVDESSLCGLESICGLVKIDLSAYEDWDRIEFKSNCGTAMWGDVVLSSDYSVSEFSDGKSSVTVTRSGDEQFVIVPVLPTSINGMSITVYKAGDILVERTSNNAITFKRMKITAVRI